MGNEQAGEQEEEENKSFYRCSKVIHDRIMWRDEGKMAARVVIQTGNYQVIGVVF